MLPNTVIMTGCSHNPVTTCRDGIREEVFLESKGYIHMLKIEAPSITYVQK